MPHITEGLPAETPDLRLTIKALSRVHTGRSLYYVFECWLVIATAIFISAAAAPPSSGLAGIAVYFLAVAMIASRQHALMVLTHEGIHKRLARSVWVNDWLARLTMAFPVFTSLAKWRFIHLYHHQYTHTAADPDRAIYARYPLNSRKFRRLVLRDLCGLNVIATLKYFIDVPCVAREFNRRFLGEDRVAQYRKLSDMRAFWMFWIVVIGGGVLWGGTQFATELLGYWLLPYCTVTQIFFRIRGAIEHGNVPDPGNPYQQTRTYFLHPVLAFFFSPKRVNYHLEHHLYPSVPFYNLLQLHVVLRQTVYPQAPAYCEPFAVSLRKLVKNEL
jgi:fatty acid desaturase